MKKIDLMNKHRFIDFLENEIEKQQKEMYANDGEGKKVIKVLIEMYTLVTDGKFDASYKNIMDGVGEVKNNYGGHPISKEVGIMLMGGNYGE